MHLYTILGFVHIFERFDCRSVPRALEHPGVEQKRQHGPERSRKPQAGCLHQVDSEPHKMVSFFIYAGFGATSSSFLSVFSRDS